MVVGRRQLVEEWKGERRNGWMERMMDVDNSKAIVKLTELVEHEES